MNIYHWRVSSLSLLFSLIIHTHNSASWFCWLIKSFFFACVNISNQWKAGYQMVRIDYFADVSGHLSSTSNIFFHLMWTPLILPQFLCWIEHFVTLTDTEVTSTRKICLTWEDSTVIFFLFITTQHKVYNTLTKKFLSVFWFVWTLKMTNDLVDNLHSGTREALEEAPKWTVTCS